MATNPPKYDPDETASALFSVYFHVEKLGGPTPLDEDGRKLDLNALPSSYRILPLADAVAALANAGTPIDFLRFAIVSLVRSVPAHADGNRTQQGPYILQLARTYDQVATATKPRTRARTSSIESALMKILEPARGDAGTPARRFQDAYKVVWGKPLGRYSIEPIYEKSEKNSETT